MKTLDERIAELVAKAPPLSDRQRATLRAAAASLPWIESESEGASE